MSSDFIPTCFCAYFIACLCKSLKVSVFIVLKLELNNIYININIFVFIKHEILYKKLALHV